MTPAASGNVFEVIQHCTGVPWRYRTNRYAQRRWRHQGPCPTGHDTHTFGFYVSEDQRHWWCFGACGANGTARDLYQILTNQPKEFWAPRPTSPGYPTPQKGSRQVQDRPRPTGATKAALAELRGLPLEFLNQLGWQDVTWRSRDSQGRFSVPAIRIPYHDENRRDPQVRYRVSLQGGDTYRWRSGTRARPYGLWQLDFARRVGYVIVEEGETDYAALMCNGIPALGLPGGGSWRPEWARYLDGIQDVYVWQEPRGGEREDLPTTGQRLVQKLGEAVPRLLVIKAPPEAKDPCELAQKLGGTFVQRMHDLMEQAATYVLPEDTTPGKPESPPRQKTFEFGPAQLFALMRQADLAQYAGRFTDLSQVGPERWKGNCPLHDDRQESFYVYRADSGWGWRCYGACATGGDIVALKRELRRLGKD